MTFKQFWFLTPFNNNPIWDNFDAPYLKLLNRSILTSRFQRCLNREQRAARWRMNGGINRPKFQWWRLTREKRQPLCRDRVNNGRQKSIVNAQTERQDSIGQLVDKQTKKSIPPFKRRLTDLCPVFQMSLEPRHEYIDWLRHRSFEMSWESHILLIGYLL